jgi:hypothetical protein
MTQAVNTVLAYVYGYVQLEMLEPGRKVDEAVELERRTHTAQYLIDRMSSGDYPTLARVFAEAANLTASDAFENGLTYVLDGIAAQVEPSDSHPEPIDMKPTVGSESVNESPPDRRVGRRRVGR